MPEFSLSLKKSAAVSDYAAMLRTGRNNFADLDVK
jgi:hypothetical protein